MEFMCNANAAVSQTKQVPVTPRFHWQDTDATFESNLAQIPLRKECSKFILYKIPERLKVLDDMVAIYIHPFSKTVPLAWSSWQRETALMFAAFCFKCVWDVEG